MCPGRHALWPVLIGLLALAFGCSTRPETAPQRLDVTFTGDTRAYTDPCGCCAGQTGGLSARAAFLEQVRSGAGEGDGALGLLLADTGSFTDGANEAKLIQSRYTAQALELLGYDVVNLGVQELKLGREKLAEVVQNLEQTAIVSANAIIGDDDRREYPALRKIRQYVQLERGGVRLFVTGVTAAQNNIHRLEGQPGVNAKGPYGSLAVLLEQAAEDECVVVLADSLSADEVRRLRELDRISMILGVAKDAAWSPGNEAAGQSLAEDSPRVFYQGRDRGRTICRAAVELEPARPAAVIESEIVELKREQQPHPLVEDLLEEVSARVTEIHQAELEEINSIDFDLVVDYLDSSACRDCHPGIFKQHRLSRHAKAYTSLRKEEEDHNGMCLPCHTVGYGVPGGFTFAKRYPVLRNVGCESCHGPGEVHVQLMTGAKLSGPLEGLNDAGLADITEKTCTGCHNEETDLTWNYAAKLELIRHDTGESD